MHRDKFIRDDPSQPEDEFVRQLSTALSAEGFNFSDKLTQWLAEEVRFNFDMASSGAKEHPQKRYREAPPRGAHDPRGVLSWWFLLPLEATSCGRSLDVEVSRE